MDDLHAVIQAAGFTRPSIFGVSEGGPMALLFAASHPASVDKLVLFGTFARTLEADDFPIGFSASNFDRMLQRMRREWGGPVMVPFFAPSLADDHAFLDWWARMLRSGASPGTAVGLMELYKEIDVRHALPAIEAPALILQKEGDRMVPQAFSEDMANSIPGGRYFELPGRRSPLLHRGPGCAAGRGRGLPHGYARIARAGAAARDRAVHRHRRVDRPRSGCWRPALARPRRCARRHRSQGACPPSWPRDQDHGGRFLRFLRRPRARNPMRAERRTRGRSDRGPRARRGPYRRVRRCRRRSRGTRRQHRRARRARSPARARCSCRRRSRTSLWDPESSSRTAAHTRSRACRANGAFTPRRRAGSPR